MTMKVRSWIRESIVTRCVNSLISMVSLRGTVYLSCTSTPLIRWLVAVLGLLWIRTIFQQNGVYSIVYIARWARLNSGLTWHGLFIMHKYTLDTLIGGRLRIIMNKDDFSTEWSILHRVYSSMSTVKQWLTTVEGKFSFLSSSFQDMAESVAKVNTARISIGLQFGLPSFDNINDQNWLAVKDTLNQALCSRGLNDLFSL